MSSSLTLTTADRGFTLLELLVVISIVGVLSTIVIVSVGNARDNARIAKAQAEVRQIATAIQQLELDTDRWPGVTAAQNVEALCSGSNNEVSDLNTAPAGLTQTHASFPGWNGPYVSEVPIDPWGNNYFFDTDYSLGGGVEAATVGSFGPNGTGLNVYDADNIIVNLLQRTCP